MKRTKSGNLVLPRYNSVGPGTMVTSPNSTSSTTTSTVGSVDARGGAEVAVKALPLERGHSMVLDIDDIEVGGEEGADGVPTGKSVAARSWWTPNVIAVPIKTSTAVFTHLGSAVSSGWSRARGAVAGSSITSYIRRVPALEKPFDLKDIHHPGDVNEI